MDTPGGAGQPGFFWAPEVVHAAGRYLLYYSVSSWGKNTSAIGLASTASLDPADGRYSWKDEGPVVRSATNDNFNAIDPSVLLDSTGRLWLAFGSFWSGIKVVELDPATGLRLQPDSALHSVAYHDPIEAPCLHQYGAYYYLFVNWGLCCRGTNSTYEIRIGRSPVATGPYLDREGKDLLQGGGSLFLGSAGRFIGPGHAGIVTIGDRQWLSCHFYDGATQGRATLGLAWLKWTADGWPSIEGDNGRLPAQSVGPRSTR